MRDVVESCSGHFLLLLSLFLLNLILPCPHFRDHLDDERHNKFIHVESPSILESEVWLHIFIAGIEGSCEEFLLVPLDEELEKLFNNLSVISLLSSFNSILVDFVLLGQIYTLLKFTVFTVEIGSNTSEL